MLVRATPPVRGPLEHYSVTMDDACSCFVCQDVTDVRARVREMEAGIAASPCTCKVCNRDRLQPEPGVVIGLPCLHRVPGSISAHSRDCGCPLCQELEKLCLLTDAAQNRSDLWTEMSYHAARHRGLGAPLMAWLKNHMLLNNRVAWWARTAGRYSLAYWLDLYHRTRTCLPS